MTLYNLKRVKEKGKWYSGAYDECGGDSGTVGYLSPV